MFQREIESELLELAKSYPVVTVIGPRQSGKTTLVRHAFPKKPYVNLEAPDIRERVLEDPRGFLEGFPEGVVLDEIQRVPILISYIQVFVDEQNKRGLYILTGSHQLELQQAITQSLSGRTALLHLLPMSLSELNSAGIELSLDEYLLNGGYPRIFQNQLDPTKAYRNYFQTYIERDLRELINVKDLSQFQRFVKLCAGRIGQLLNTEGLGNEVGVSSHTVKHWISILEASFVVIRLQPYFENFGKRIIKSPKLYFTDVGLASYLLSIENVSQMARDPLRGNLVENLILVELMKARFNQGLDSQLYFFRDAQGHEVDAIFQSGNTLVPIEIKASKTYSSEFTKNLRFFKELVQERCVNGFLIYSGETMRNIGPFTAINFLRAKEVVLL
jgi:predicted AAA+ superfamily ATPase